MTSFSQDHADVNVINSCYDMQKHKNANMGKKNLKQIILFLFNLWHKFLLSNKKKKIFWFMPIMEMEKCLTH